MLNRILRFFQSPFVHPLQKRVPSPARTTQDLVRNKHKAAILQARISVFFERFNPTPVKAEVPHYRVGSQDPMHRIESFITFAELAVDKAFYRTGL